MDAILESNKRTGDRRCSKVKGFRGQVGGIWNFFLGVLPTLYHCIIIIIIMAL